MFSLTKLLEEPVLRNSSTDTSTDKRMPVNLIALAKAPSIDYLDMHMYMLGIENDSISQYFYDDLKSCKMG